MIQHHLQKISRPLLDRMDITVEAPRVTMKELTGVCKNESSETIRSRVMKVHALQQERYQCEKFQYNSRIPGDKVEYYCTMDQEARKQLETVYDRMDLSARGYHRLIRVARTIADMESSEKIREHHMVEALLYHSMDERLWRVKYEI